MNQERQLYEGMYIVSALLSEEARKKALERIVSSIETHGGEIKNVVDWGRRKFAYQIEKRKEGFYYVIYFDAETSKMPKIWDEYKLNEDLVRFMTLKTDAVREKLEFKPLRSGE